MDDAKFLEACGVAIDQKWLVESACIGKQPEARRYAGSLMRIADILASVRTSRTFTEREQG